MAIEQSPRINQTALSSAILNPPEGKIEEMVEKININFEYWDTVKYKKCPPDCTPTDLWTYVKAARIKSAITVWEKYGVSLSLTNNMQKKCHEIDMNWGEVGGQTQPLTAKQKNSTLSVR